MTRTKNYLFKTLISVAVVALMSISMILPAFADDDVYLGETGTGPASPARSVITKIFDMPVGTTVPESIFTFEFTKMSFDGDDYDDGTKKPEMPDLGAKIIYTADDIKDKDVAKITEGDTVRYVKISEDLTKDVIWPAVGIYVYTIHETQTGVTLDGLTGKTGAYYSKAVYNIEIWVDEDDNGVKYVKYVNPRISKTTEEIDVYYPGTDGGKKVKPQPGEWGKDEITTEDVIENFSGIIFTNSYWKSDGDEGTVFQVTKEVTGLGSSRYRNEYFSFKVTVTQPSVVVLEENEVLKYTAYVVGADGGIVKTDANHPDTNETTGYFEVTAGTVFTVKLKHNEKLMFTDLHVGATVKVEEQLEDDDNFIPSYKHNFFNETLSEKFDGKVVGINWGFPNDEDEGPHYLPEGNDTKADFTNTLKNTTPTGLDVDDLPYIVLIGVAAAGLAAFVVMKSRKRTKEDV